MLQNKLLLLFAGTSFAAARPSQHGRLENRAPPSVTIQNGTVIGSSFLGVDTFNGIPFAQPPVGDLRLKPPQPVIKNFGTLAATGTPAACPQLSLLGGSSNASSLPAETRSNVSGILAMDNASSSNGQEDCLTLNVQRPSSANATSKLPVLVWIFGGGFVAGSSNYNGRPLIDKSNALGSPIIYVALNYRLGGFGFLAGKEVQRDGSTNLGLRDQRLALQWVQENIGAFGGDPDKVTIWGESAGSASVFDQLLVNKGDNTYRGKPLFRGAIMDSGSIFGTLDVNSAGPQSIYDSIVSQAGCASSADTLQCLRQVPYQTLYNAFAANQGTNLINANYFPRPDPSSNFFALSQETATQQGLIANVPFIIGDQEDEGTLFTFSRKNISTTDDVIDVLQKGFPQSPRELVAELVATYPDDVSAGSPFRTGIFNEIYPQYKRLSAIVGDASFTLTRRYLLTLRSAKIQTWSYLSTYFHGLPVLGTTHATDILAIYYGLASPIPAESVRGYYVSFVATGDPNGLNKRTLLPAWPQYNNTGRQLMCFGSLTNSLTPDTFRSQAYQFVEDHISDLRI